MAGDLDGKRREKMRVVMEAVWEVVASLWAFSFCMMEHCYLDVRSILHGNLSALTSNSFSIPSGVNEATEASLMTSAPTSRAMVRRNKADSLGLANAMLNERLNKRKRASEKEG